MIIETDHKPLESIWKKTITSASPRLQRLLLKMAKYDVEIRYIQGKTNVIADALSRVSHMEPPMQENEVPLLEVDTITNTLPASPAKIEEIRECTDQDVVLAHLKDVVHHGWPEYPNECPQDLREFWNFREDLSIEDGLILKGHRLVIPRKLRPHISVANHTPRIPGNREVSPESKRLFIMARYIKRHKGNDSELCHVHTVLQTAAERGTKASQRAQFPMAEAWM